MGFLDELGEMASSVAGLFRSTLGAVDPVLLQTGTPATAVVTGLTARATTITVMNGLTERICDFDLKVMPPGGQPYDVRVTQGIPEVFIPQIMQNPTVAVRIDPDDPARVAIDVVAGAANGGATTLPAPAADDHDSAAWILANGSDVTVVVNGSRPLPGLRNAAGDEVHALTLTVEAAEGEAPYQVQVGNAVPAAALPLLVAGARLRARRGDDPGDVVVDWAANGSPGAVIL